MRPALSALALVVLPQAAGETVVCRHPTAGATAPYDAARVVAAWESVLSRARDASAAAYRLPARPTSPHDEGFEPFDAGLRAGHVAPERKEIAWNPPAAWVGRTLVFASASRIAEGPMPPNAIPVVTRVRSSAELRRVLELSPEPPLWATPRVVAAFGVRHDETAVTILDARTVELRRY